LKDQSTNRSLSGKLNWTGLDIRSFTMIATLVLIWIVFTVMTDGTFLSARNISNLTVQMAVVTILGAGMVLVIVTGNIDLSVGSLVGLVGGVAAALMVWEGWGTIPTILVVLALGLVCGLIQGFATVYLGIPAFIVTLGGMMALRGALLGITKGISIAPMNNDYKMLGSQYLPQVATYVLAAIAVVIVLYSMISQRRNRAKHNMPLESSGKFALKLVVAIGLIAVFTVVMNSYKGLPIPVLIMIGVVAILSFVASQTKFGRYVYAIGGNIQAARYSGVNVKKIVLLTFMINGFVCAIAGIVQSARLNAGAPSTGQMMELDAIAAAVIGGTSMSGGVGKVYGAILGALIMASLDNGMSMMNMDAFWQYIVKGLILVLAVWLDMAMKKRGTAA